MNVAPAISTWLEDVLAASGERVHSISEGAQGARAVRFVVATSRRALVLKVFERDGPFAAREIHAYDVLVARTPNVIVPVIATSSVLRSILLEQVVGSDLFGALAVSPSHEVMQTLALAISELAISTHGHVMLDDTAPTEVAAMRAGL